MVSSAFVLHVHFMTAEKKSVAVTLTLHVCIYCVLGYWEAIINYCNCKSKGRDTNVIATDISEIAVLQTALWANKLKLLLKEVVSKFVQSIY